MQRVSEPSNDDLPANFEFGHYVIHECIGRGGMARVYRAEHTRLNKPVALKVIDHWVLGKPGGKDRFLREARTAAAIKHPNVVDIIDLGVWQDRPYLVMELLNGCDLENELERRGALPDEEVCGLALPVIAGMIAVHDAGVVHRDIKPSNIFLAQGPGGEIVPKVLDFGISKVSDNLLEPMQGLTKTREIIGTPTYMAPEALNGARQLGLHADQYALGAVLYDCAVGRPPFEGETLLELLKAIALGVVAPPRSIRPEISEDFERAILRAMHSNPAARFESLRDLGRALWPFCDERMRAIWAPSFGDRAPFKSAALVKVAHEPPAVGKRPRGRVTAIRRWAPLAAVALLGVVVIKYPPWGDPSAPTSSPAEAPPPPVVERQSLLVNPAVPPKAQAADSRPSNVAAAVVNGEAQPNAAAATFLDEAAAAKSPPPSVSRRAIKSVRNVAFRPGNPRKRAQRVDDSRASVLDPDLNELFAMPAVSKSPATGAPDRDVELRGLFPEDETRTAGANGAPLDDLD